MTEIQAILMLILVPLLSGLLGVWLGAKSLKATLNKQYRKKWGKRYE